MDDNRPMKRVKKRLTLRFGRDAAERLAFTEDISSTGIFIKTAQVIPPGSPIKIAIDLEHDEKVQLEGTVVWAKKVPPEMLRMARKCGMGIKIRKFLEGEQAYLKLVA